MDAWQIVALLGCVIMIYAWIFMRRQESVDHTEILTEVDQTLQLYVTEIMDSNRHVIEQVERMKQDIVIERDQWKERLQKLEHDMTALREEQTASSNHAASDRMTSSEALIHDRYRELIEMQRQGLSMNEIVKKSGMNHGEVKFILQLAAREDY